MATLTPEQAAYLRRHGVSVNEVCDATGMRTKSYRSLMKMLEKTIAIGVTPCMQGGHTMRNRSGHCVQCNPASFAFQGRFEREAYIYVAGSIQKEIIKVGFSESPGSRADVLNGLRYGRTSDWSLLFHVRCAKAGTVENEVQKNLESYATPGTYIREGREVGCYELFTCSYGAARKSIESVLDASVMSQCWERRFANIEYDFPCVEGWGSYRQGNRFNS